MATSLPTARRVTGTIAYIALSVLAIAVVGLLPMDDYTMHILVQTASYSIAVFGLTVVLGLCGQINLAQAAFFGFGAYTVGLGTADLHLNFWVALALGAGIALVMGAFLGLTTLRLGGHYLAMVTISFQQIVTLIMVNWIPVTHGPDGVGRIQRPSMFQTPHAFLGLCVLTMALIGYLVWRLPQTPLGRSMRAVRDNELAAGVAGINVYRTKVAAFALSALLGGIGGGLFAGGFAYVSPDQFSFAESIVFITMTLLGGVATPVGALIGTALLIVLPVLFVVGLVIQRLVIQPLQSESMMQMFATFALLTILQNAMLVLTRGEGYSVNTRWSQMGLEVGDIRLTATRLIILGSVTAIAIGLHLFLKHTLTGKSIRAVTQDRQAALLMGINVNRTFTVTFGIGAALAGVAGVLLAPIYTLSPGIGGNFIFAAFAVVVLGGLGSVAGAYFGGAIVGIVEAFAGYYIDPELKQAIWFLIFLGVLVFKPSGLFGQVGAEEIGFREQS